MDAKKSMISSGELDLSELLSLIWKNKISILKTTTIFIFFGFIIAIFTPNTYTSTSKLVPQSSDKKNVGGLSGLAAIAGINLNNIYSGEVLSPSVYPIIISNINFQKELIYSKFNCEKSKQPISYYEYQTNKKYKKFSLIGILNKYVIGLPSIVLKTIKSNDINTNIHKNDTLIESLTIKEFEVIKTLNDNFSLEVNNKDGYITITAKSNEAIISAQLVLRIQELLQKYLTEFKLDKVRNNLAFVETNYNEIKAKFNEKQAELANFRDSNIGLLSAKAKTQEEKLISEYNLLFGIYSEIAKQREQAKIAITETTPILTIIQPAVIPTEKSGPKRLVILFSFTILGFLIGIIKINIGGIVAKYSSIFKRNID